MAIKDFSKWLSNDALQPQNMTALLVALAQGQFVAEDIFPVVPSPDSFQWLTEVSNDAFTLAKKRGERGEAEIQELYDKTLSATAYEYFSKSEITAKTLRSGNIFSFVNLVARKTQAIANKIRMNVEKDMIDALKDTTTYTTINTASASAAWSSYSTSDPYRNIEVAKTKIMTTAFVQPDTIVIGASDKTNMLLSDNVRDSIQYTMNYNFEGLGSEKMAGLDIYVSTAIYKSAGVNYSILSGSTIVLKRGIVGELREPQPYDAYSEWDKSIKVLNIYGSRVVKPIIIQPLAICKLAIK